MDKQVPFFVAVGASAGGLEAIKEFFQSVSSEKRGVVWVVIQHLSPDYKSMMRELLSSSTDMPIQLAENGLRPEPEHVYLISPNTNLRLSQDGCFVTERQRRDYAVPNLPIDLFFESIAAFAGNRAIGVVLSGTGSDGTRGARLIREAGGFVLCQSLESAKFDGMPKSVIANGLADVVDEISALPTHIETFIVHPFAQGQGIISTSRSDVNVKPLDQLFLLLERHKVDFSAYKSSTVNRRIERRIQKCRKSSLGDYLHYASNTPSEIDALYAELLIGVTSFFRDREIYIEPLRAALTTRVEERSEPKEFRFWVAGCSSGEEAYTLAILFCEICEVLTTAPKLKLFATDIDSVALAKASTGEYPESIINDMPKDYLAKYFVPHGDTFSVSSRIREMVVFAKHDLMRDPPFTRIDMVSCRNLLIYLDPVHQTQILENFNFSLKPGGLMLLGSSESLGEAEHLFEVVDKRAKLFRSIGASARRSARTSNSVALTQTAGQSLLQRETSALKKSQLEYRAADQLKIYRSMLDALGTHRQLPFSILVDAGHSVVRIFGTMPQVFRPMTGGLETEVTKLLVKELQAPVSSGLARAYRSGEVIRFKNIQLDINSDGKPVLVSVTIVPFNTQTAKSFPDHALLMIVQTDAPVTPETQAQFEADHESRLRVADLEHELQITRENLQATIEELETSNEELQATNEELLASNEELQSTNEELQSVNEELYTVNAEHHERLQELRKLQNDFAFLLAARDMSLLYVDHLGEITGFTPGAVRIFNILDQDIGRPISHISNQVTEVDLAEKVYEVLQTEQPFRTRVNVPKSGGFDISIHFEASASTQSSSTKRVLVIMERV